MSLRMLTRPGDAILAEEYTFSAAVETAMPMGLLVFGVKMDEQGLLPDVMDEMLTEWEAQERRAAKPSVLYTVPTGQNPTGATQGAERRKALYRVAQKHDLMVIEDEPYYFLQMGEYKRSSELEGGSGQDEGKSDKASDGAHTLDSNDASSSPSSSPSSKYDTFLSSLLPSLLSLDTDGRVLRLDSFSKVLAPGSRVGWVTASEQLVGAYVRHADVSTQCPSGTSQLMLFKLLEEHWGHDGYLDWLMHLRDEYTRRRDGMIEACEKYLGGGEERGVGRIVKWAVPRAGMFVSIFRLRRCCCCCCCY